jgi:hypothetical protein
VPAGFPNLGSTNASVNIFNGSASTANVAVHFLDRNGANLAGAVVPGGSGPSDVYPGETGAATVAVAAGTTRIVPWHTALGNPATDANTPATIRIVSDQPVVVGVGVSFGGFFQIHCQFLHP